MSRKAKGKRPAYFDDPDNDKLLAIVMALAGEVSVLRERLDTIERVARMKALWQLEDVEAYVPDEAVAAERDTWRAEYLARLLRIVHHEGESVDRRETHEGYAAAIVAVSDTSAASA